MAKIVSRARQLRYAYQAQLGRAVTIEEIAEAIGEDRRTVMKVERNQWKEIRKEVIEKLGAFYHAKGLDARGIIEFDPNGQQTPELVAA